MTTDTDDKPAPSTLRRMLTNPFLMLALAGLSWAGNHIAAKAGAMPCLSTRYSGAKDMAMPATSCMDTHKNRMVAIGRSA